jgi:hypothetical protein
MTTGPISCPSVLRAAATAAEDAELSTEDTELRDEGTGVSFWARGPGISTTSGFRGTRWSSRVANE